MMVLTIVAVLAVAGIAALFLRPRDRCCWCNRVRRGCVIVLGGVVCRACARKYDAPAGALARKKRV